MASDLQPLLVPTPRRIHRLGPSGVSLTQRPVLATDAAIPAQGYRLRVGGGSGPDVLIESADAAGRRHALATLAQLQRQFGEVGPSMAIEDWPAIAVRGVMLDVSRCRVPTMSELRRKVRVFSELKLNHLQLYTEHTFAYAGHEAVWRGSSPMTAQQYGRLGAWCEEAGLELAANQNCFGHLDRWLRLPAYAHLAETHGEFDFFGLTMHGPFSLCPVDPGSAAFVRDLLSELCANFESPLVNIGCDETLDIGWGRSRGRVREVGRTRVYMDFVLRICGDVLRMGRRPMLWGDIALRDPRCLNELPHESVVLAWGYEPDSPFDQWGAALSGAGREFWVCPGTSAWRSFVGRTTERRGNLSASVASSIRHGAAGLLVTDWGDMGHRQQDPVSMLAIAEAASRAWNPDSTPDLRAISWHIFGDRTGHVAKWLADLGDIDAEMRANAGVRGANAEAAPLRNASALFEAVHPSGFETALPTHEGPWRDLLARIDDLRRSMPQFSAAEAHGGIESTPRLLADELRHTLDQAGVAARIAIARRSEAPPRGHTDIRERLHAIMADQRRLWLARSRTGGLRESLSYWEALPESGAAREV
ncbi:MAG: hypothetical protein H6811_01980 [Phycisphaeraceae bacterium]|nr:hypothetical protein [Phycisphaeraceae bacterium]